MPSLVNNPIISTIANAVARGATTAAGPTGTPAVGTSSTPSSPFAALMQRVAQNASYMTGTGQANDAERYRQQMLQMQQQHQARQDAINDLQTRLEMAKAGAKPVNSDGMVSNPSTTFDNSVPGVAGTAPSNPAGRPASAFDAPDIGAAPMPGLSLPSTTVSGNVPADAARVVALPGSGQKYQLPSQADQDTRTAAMADQASARRTKEVAANADVQESAKEKLLAAARQPIEDDEADELGVPRGSKYSAAELSLLRRGKAAETNAGANSTRADAAAARQPVLKAIADKDGNAVIVGPDGKATPVLDPDGNQLKLPLPKGKGPGAAAPAGSDGLTAAQRLRQQDSDQKLADSLQQREQELWKQAGPLQDLLAKAPQGAQSVPSQTNPKLKVSVADTQAKLNAIKAQIAGLQQTQKRLIEKWGGTYSNGAQASHPAAGGSAQKVLDGNTAQQYFQKAGNDPAKARQMAAADGYSIPQLQ